MRGKTGTLTIRGLPPTADIRLVTGTDILNDFPCHIHGEYCLGIIMAGRRGMTISGSEILLEDGDIFAVNPGEPHTSFSVDGRPHSYAVLLVPVAQMENMAADMSSVSHRPFFRHRIHDAAAGDEFRRLLEACPVPEGVETVIRSFAACCLAHHACTGCCVERGCATPAVERVRRHIDENYTETLNMETLSEHAGVSPFHLNRRFSRETGMSPHAYQIHRRIELSKKLLLDGYPISYVSMESGFADQGHYTRFFKRITGTTPGRFIICNGR